MTQPAPARIPPSPWPIADEAVRAALLAAYADGSWGKYDGPNCKQLEARLRELHSAEQVFLTCSGTIAVELALRGLKVGPGDEVILAGYDFAGNFRAIEAVGATPVLVDLAADSWSLEVAAIPQAVGPRTKAVIASHLHGTQVDMRRLMEIAEERGLAVIEDACQSPGALVQGRIAGSWGDCGIHSFGGSKLLTAGRGGAIVTNRADVLQRIKVFSERGNQAFPLSELQAAVLLPQIEKLAERNTHRWQNVRRLITACQGITGLSTLALPVDGSQPAFYKVAWMLESAAAAASPEQGNGMRQAFLAALQSRGIAIDEGFRGFASRSSQRCRVVGELIHARRAAQGTLLLHHPVLLESPETMDFIANALQESATAATNRN